MTDHTHVGWSVNDDEPVLRSHLERDHGVAANPGIDRLDLAQVHRDLHADD